MIVPRSVFEDLVVRALDELPGEFLHALDNIEVVVEQEPTPSQLASVGATGGALLGLYEGVPLTQRHSSYGLVLPDRISIFRGPILRSARTETEIRRIVRRTVIHEIAHHFGISDDRLRELGAY